MCRALPTWMAAEAITTIPPPSASSSVSGNSTGSVTSPNAANSDGGATAAQRLAANRAAGTTFGQAIESDLGQSCRTVEQQITVETECGVRTRLDFLTLDPITGNVCCVECKASSTAHMFNRFLGTFTSDGQTEKRNEGADVPFVDQTVSEFFSRFAGASFNRGLYRVLRPGDVQGWNTTIGAAFPTFKERATCFAVDWLGRMFALDSGRHVNGRPRVTIFEPGTGQALVVPCDIETFHEEELVDYQDAALAKVFFDQWIKVGCAPSYSQCVGYKRPLFLGGIDSVENLELIDLDVYWTISAKLIARLGDAPLGTRMKVSGR